VVSLPGNTGHFDIIVKRYPSPEGDMSRFLHGLVPGDSVQVRGPVVALGNNHASRDGDSDGDSGGDGAAALGSSGVNAAAAWHAKRKVGMLAGGTGVTPMIQLVRYALERNQDAPTADTTAAPRAKDDDDDDEATATLAARTSSDGETAVAAGTIGQFPWQRKSQLSLVVSDQAATDAIFKKELAKISKQNKDVVSVYRTLTRHAPKGWNQGRGRMSKVMLRHLLPPPGPDTIIFVAGPRGFVEHVAGPSEVVVPAEQRRMSWGRDKARGKKRPVGGLLGELGYTSEMVQVL
jgi:cytochrome-b5 reductase